MLGFDKEGAKELGGELVGTGTWIGTAGIDPGREYAYVSHSLVLAELWMAFSARGIPYVSVAPSLSASR